MARGGIGSWYYSEQFGYDRAAVACGIPLSVWDEMTPEQQGRTVEVWGAERTMREWVVYLSQPKGEV